MTHRSRLRKLEQAWEARAAMQGTMVQVTCPCCQDCRVMSGVGGLTILPKKAPSREAWQAAQAQREAFTACWKAHHWR